jgi:Mg-chelatase subunit ChlI
VPLDVLEDRLLGAVDVEKSVRTGETVFEPGLLARAHRGVLYVDDINLLDESTSNLLLEALSTGWVTVEREGLSVRHPCKPLLIATFNPEETELREHLMDRIGICLSADAEPLSQADRLEAVSRALDFSRSPSEMTAQFADTQEAMKTSILFAREYLKGMKLSRPQMKYLCEEAMRAGVQGHRGEIFAVEVARANAALNGEERVSSEDLQMGVRLSIAPRGTQITAPPQDDMMQAPPPPPPPQNKEEEDDKDQEEEPEKEEEPDPEDQEDAAPPVPEEFMFDVEGVALDPDVMKFTNKAKTGNSGSRGLIFSEERGRYIKPILPRGRVRKLAVDATMRSAAPYQKKRRERAEALALASGDRSKLRGVYIEQSDVRAKKMARKAGSLVIFVVDASGSMALNRMNAAKGAAIGLLAEAYQSRDKICLVTFQVPLPPPLAPRPLLPSPSCAIGRDNTEGTVAQQMVGKLSSLPPPRDYPSQPLPAPSSSPPHALPPPQGDFAQVLLPPTRSIAMAKNRLERMPCGGGSPLAHALNLAAQTGITAQKSGDVGEVLVVCISDGRANVPLSTSIGRPTDEPMGKAELKEEVINTARMLGQLSGFKVFRPPSPPPVFLPHLSPPGIPAPFHLPTSPPSLLTHLNTTSPLSPLPFPRTGAHARLGEQVRFHRPRKGDRRGRAGKVPLHPQALAGGRGRAAGHRRPQEQVDRAKGLAGCSRAGWRWRRGAAVGLTVCRACRRPAMIQETGCCGGSRRRCWVQTSAKDYLSHRS